MAPIVARLGCEGRNCPSVGGRIFFIAAVALGCATSARAAPPLEPVLTAGLTAIRQRALLDLPVSTLALEGLKGLSAIDPSIGVTAEDQTHLLVRYDGRRVLEVDDPPLNDAAAWAAVIQRICDVVTPLSAALKRADAERLYQAIFDSALGRLDVFSHYAGAVEARAHRAERDGYGGIGILYDVDDDGMVLTAVIPDTPAAAARLAVNDRIEAIDGNPVGGLDRDGIAERLLGPPDSAVVLTVAHADGSPTSVLTLRRAFVVAPTVRLGIDRRIATITVSGFNQNTATAVRDMLNQATRRHANNDIILDLRENPGGLLNQGIAVADLFIARGRILSTRGRHPESDKTFDARPGDPGEQTRLVVLVDGHTASAAEVVAAALQDAGRAVVVGTNTFGKGTVQTVVRLPNDGELTLTWSRFYAPSGYALHGLGVLPTLCTSGTATPDALLAPLEPRSVPKDRTVIADLLASGPVVGSSFDAWRAVALDDKDKRATLRGLCPAEDHADRTVDDIVARRLLVSPQLFDRALALTDGNHHRRRRD